MHISCGEISWQLFHKVYEEDQQLQANLKAAPKPTTNVQHPGNCMESVPVTLANFHPSTSAAIKTYIPESDDAATFLTLIYTWWTISNSKQRHIHGRRIMNTVVPDDQNPQFLCPFACWIEEWNLMKIKNAKKFTLPAQTSFALRRTLRCHDALIEDLLAEGFDFVLTVRFQSDALERRYGQYRHMS